MVDLVLEQDKSIQSEQKPDFKNIKALLDSYSSTFHELYQDQGPLLALRRMGRSVLKVTPEITGNISLENYTISRLFSCLAEEEDRSLLLEAMTRAGVVEDPDGSSKSHFFNTLNRLNREVRISDPNDKRLVDSAEAIMLMFDSLGNEHSKQTALTSLLITGTSDAKRFAVDHGVSIESVKDFEDPQKIDEYLCCREEFENDIQLNDLMNNRFDEFRSISVPVSNENFDDESIFLTEAKKIVESLDVETTAKEACLLYSYNFLKKYPEITNEGRRFLIEKLTRLNKQEKLYMQKDVPLPPLGTEVEIPETDNRPLNEFILQSFGISHYDEGDLLEINKTYSYSGEIQSRVLEEVAKMGVIPLAHAKKGLGEIPREVPLSLHMNFGLPSELDNNMYLKNDYMEDFQTIVNWVAYAFTSPDRISKRKTHSSWFLRDRKTKASNKSGNRRFEIRVSEFKDFSTFRMIDETQKLTGALFSYLKKMNGHKLSDKESKLSELWVVFKSDVNKIMSKYSVKSMLFDTSSDEAAEIASEERLRNEMRVISRIQTKEISRVVFPNK